MRIVLALAALALSAASNALSFDDIKLWAGTGGNEAALVVDWNDGQANESLVWGYRWDGDANGEDMLRAIVQADPNLYVKVSGHGAFGSALFGVGYDRDGGGLSLTTGESFVDRVVTIPVNDWSHADGGNPADPADRYREGWYTGYWAYYVADTDGTYPMTWGYSGLGMSGRKLQNGSWDGWSYDDFSGTANLDAPTPVPEPASLVAVALGFGTLARRRRK